MLYCLLVSFVLCFNRYVHAGFHRPHLPFVVPQSFLDLYPAEDISLPPNPYAPAGMPQVVAYPLVLYVLLCAVIVCVI